MTGQTLWPGIMLGLCLAAPEAASQHLLINEIDYDQPGTDLAEFIEIYNPAAAAQDLRSVVLMLVNGANNSLYASVRLGPAGSIPGGGYLVIRSATVIVPAGTATLAFARSQDNIQNGAPDGAALVDTSTGTVIDALSYEGSITSVQLPSVGTVSLVEGTALPVGVLDIGPGSLARIPNGQDTDNASSDWQYTATITPGATNTASPTGVGRNPGDPNQASLAYVLEENYPNPCNSSTVIRYRLPCESTIRLSVFDICGREVALLRNTKEPAGVHAATFDARGMASGVYFYRLEAGSFTSTRKMVTIR